MENKLTFVGTEEGDWEGIYVNGNLFEERHSLSKTDYMHLISQFKAFSSEIEEYTLTEDQIEELGGTFPIDIEDLEEMIAEGE